MAHQRFKQIPAILTDTAVRKIMEKRAAGWTQKRIADKFSTSQTTVSNIFRGLVYSRITGIKPRPRKTRRAA